jgi:hypothetical protein
VGIISIYQTRKERKSMKKNRYGNKIVGYVRYVLKLYSGEYKHKQNLLVIVEKEDRKEFEKYIRDIEAIRHPQRITMEELRLMNEKMFRKYFMAEQGIILHIFYPKDIYSEDNANNVAALLDEWRRLDGRQRTE